MNQHARLYMTLFLLIGGAMGLSRLRVSADSPISAWSTPLRQTTIQQNATQSADISSSSKISSQSTATLATPDLIDLALSNGDINQDTANLYLVYALSDYTKLPEQFQSDVPWFGTLSMLHLQKSVDSMQNRSAQVAVQSFLTGSCSSVTSPLTNVINSTHFHFEYTSINGGLTASDYVTSLETTWTVEIDDFGWAAPPVRNNNPPPGNRYHVRADSLGGGLYGFVSSSGTHAGVVGNNPNTPWNDVDASASCMVLNNNFSGFPGTPQRALDATTAHEFAHSIQFGLGVLSGSNSMDSSWVEGGATWMEDEVFDASDDNHNYLWPDFSSCMGEYDASPYPYWITFRGLTERYGAGIVGGSEQVMQEVFEAVSQSTTNNTLPALNAALTSRGTNLDDAYHAYAIAVKHQKACVGNFDYPYCLEEGPEYVANVGSLPSVSGSVNSIGQSYSGRVADNYALNWIALPTGAESYDVVVENNSPQAELQATVVCDTGSEFRGETNSVVLSGNQMSTIEEFDPTGCDTVTLVVTNQLRTAEDPNSCGTHSYTVSVETLEPPMFKQYLPIIHK